MAGIQCLGNGFRDFSLEPTVGIGNRVGPAVPGHLGLRVLGILGQASSSQLSSQPDEPLGDQYIACRRMSAMSGLSPAYLGIPAEIFFQPPDYFWEH